MLPGALVVGRDRGASVGTVPFPTRQVGGNQLTNGEGGRCRIVATPCVVADRDEVSTGRFLVREAALGVAVAIRFTPVGTVALDRALAPPRSLSLVRHQDAP